jgi:hypothetical protein
MEIRFALLLGRFDASSASKRQRKRPETESPAKSGPRFDNCVHYQPIWIAHGQDVLEGGGTLKSSARNFSCTHGATLGENEALIPLGTGKTCLTGSGVLCFFTS